MRAFDGTFGKENAVVGQNADGITVDMGKTGYQCRPIILFKLIKFRAIDETRNNLPYIEGSAHVLRNQAVNFRRIIQGSLRRTYVQRHRLHLVERGNTAPRDFQRMLVTLRHMIRHAGDARMHLRPAQILGRDHLPRCRLYQRRTGEKDCALIADDDAFIAHGRNIGPARRAGSHDNRDLRNAEGGHIRLIIEAAAEMIAIREHILLVRQVGPARVNQIDTGEMVLQRHFLRPEMLLHRQRIVSPALHRRIVADDDAFAPLDPADTGDDPGGMDIPAIHIPGGHLAEFQKRRSGVEKPPHPLSRQEFAAREMLLPRPLAAALLDGCDLVFQILNQRAHMSGIGLEILASCVEITFQYRHSFLFPLRAISNRLLGERRPLCYAKVLEQVIKRE